MNHSTAERLRAIKDRQARAGATTEERIAKSEQACKAAGIRPRLTGTTYSATAEDEFEAANRALPASQQRD